MLEFWRTSLAGVTPGVRILYRPEGVRQTTIFIEALVAQ